MDDADRQDLAALADGTLEPEAREALQRRVDESPELADALARQQDALTAIRATEEEPAPYALRAMVEAMAARAAAETRHDRPAARAPRRRLIPRPRALAFGGSAVALAAAAVVLFSGGASGPSVAEAAQVALAPPRSPAPAAQPDERWLAASVDGVAYPYWADANGWRAVGSRTDAVEGRAVRTVFYDDAQGRRIGYAIAAGGPLSVAHGTSVGRFTVVRTNGAAVVTWLRDGHTCILAARGVDASVLMKLADSD
jgi:anti-sigma factor RsiW